VSRLVGAGTVAAYQAWRRLRDKLWSWLASGAFASFGRHSTIALPVRLLNAGRIAIGHHVFLGPDCWLQVLPGPACAAPRLEIGDGTQVSGSAVLSAAQSIVLEDHVLLARNVYVADHSHAYAAAGTPVLAQGLDKVKPVRVRSGAWLGQNVVVCPGVTIGRGSVVGAGSVVTTDLPDWCVAVGAPARVVKTFAKAPIGEPVTV
jgi:acetyltransferase-like isoleucine patch superfamily enzyme